MLLVLMPACKMIATVGVCAGVEVHEGNVLQKNHQLSSVLNPVAAEEKYQIPSAKASAELAKVPSTRGLKRESLPRRFRGLRNEIEVRFRFRA